MPSLLEVYEQLRPFKVRALYFRSALVCFLSFTPSTTILSEPESFKLLSQHDFTIIFTAIFVIFVFC